MSLRRWLCVPIALALCGAAAWQLLQGHEVTALALVALAAAAKFWLWD
jgi:hypothetical protein